MQVNGSGFCWGLSFLALMLNAADYSKEFVCGFVNKATKGSYSAGLAQGGQKRASAWWPSKLLFKLEALIREAVAGRLAAYVQEGDSSELGTARGLLSTTWATKQQEEAPGRWVITSRLRS